MAQNENYSQVDLRIGTEEQFNAKVGTLPAGTLFGVTDSTVSKADLSTDLKNEINGKINKPANPTSDSAVVINSSGTISTKPLSSITGKAEVAVSSTTPLNDEILWINPDGTSGGGSSGGGKLYRHDMYFFVGPPEGYRITIYTSNATPYTPETFFADSDNGLIYCCGTAEISGKIYPIYMTVIGDTLKRIIYINSDGGQTSKDINVSQLHGSDTVTEV